MGIYKDTQNLEIRFFFFYIFLFLHHILYIKMMATRKDQPQISSVMIPEMSLKKRKFVALFVYPL